MVRTRLECLPCLLRQALDAARLVTDDEELHHSVMLRACDVFRLIDVRRSPPFLAQRIHRIIRAVVGNEDPYRAIKSEMNRLCVQLLRPLRERIAAAPDPFSAAVRVAIAGNCIDNGPRSGPSARHVKAFLTSALDRPLVGSPARLDREARKAERILYLADNAGEIAIDRLLIERLPVGRVTVAVRGHPVINDATLADARAVGLGRVARVIDNGSDAPGTLLDDCSAAFRETFAAADLIIAKGQGNFESLSGLGDQRIHHLLIPKCPLVARHVDAPQDSLVLWSAGRGRGARRRPTGAHRQGRASTAGGTAVAGGATSR